MIVPAVPVPVKRDVGTLLFQPIEAEVDTFAGAVSEVESELDPPTVPIPLPPDAPVEVCLPCVHDTPAAEVAFSHGAWLLWLLAGTPAALEAPVSGEHVAKTVMVVGI